MFAVEERERRTQVATLHPFATPHPCFCSVGASSALSVLGIRNCIEYVSSNSDKLSYLGVLA